MTPILRICGMRTAPADSVESAASEMWEAIQTIRRVSLPDARWSIRKTPTQGLNFHSAKALASALAISGPRRASEHSPGTPTHRLTLRAERRGADALLLLAGFTPAALHSGAVSETPGARIECVVAPAALGEGSARSGFPEILFEILVSALRLDAARAVPGNSSVDARARNRPQLGWLTYLPHRLGPIPQLPAAASAKEIATGWIVRAESSLPASADKAYDDSLAHLRHALGARVLMDGPSYPGRAAERPSAPIAPWLRSVDPAPATETPSYLRKSDPSGRVPTVPSVASPGVATPARAPAQPFTAETVEVDLAKILAGRVATMPFDPSRAPSVSAPSAVPAARHELSGATMDIDVAALARKALAAGPAPQRPPVPNLPTLELSPSPPPVPPPAAPPGKRLVRFDRQTGQPLAQPYWEDIPGAPNRKDR